MEKKKEKRQARQLPVEGVHRIYNYDYNSRGLDPSAALVPAVEALGSKVVNSATGEVIAERPNAFYALDRISHATYEEDPGTPLITDFSRARDLKARALALVGGSDISQLFNNEAEVDDDHLMDELDKLPDSDVLDFNQILSATPYAVGEDGMANFERELASSKEEVEELRNFMRLKDDPLIKEIVSMDREQLEAFIVAGQKKIATEEQPQVPAKVE